MVSLAGVGLGDSDGRVSEVGVPRDELGESLLYSTTPQTSANTRTTAMLVPRFMTFLSGAALYGTRTTAGREGRPERGYTQGAGPIPTRGGRKLAAAPAASPAPPSPRGPTSNPSPVPRRGGWRCAPPS